MATRPPNTPALENHAGPRIPYHTAPGAIGALFTSFLLARFDILHAEQKLELMTVEPEDRDWVLARLAETELLISRLRPGNTVH